MADNPAGSGSSPQTDPLAPGAAVASAPTQPSLPGGPTESEGVGEGDEVVEIKEGIVADAGAGVDNRQADEGPSRLNGRERKRRREQTARKTRALREPIYLIEHEVRSESDSAQFRVLGTTGSAYTVDFYVTKRGARAGCAIWKCSCTDFAMKRRACKHIHFIWYRVLGIDADSMVPGSEPFFDGVAALQERLLSHAAFHDAERSADPESDISTGRSRPRRRSSHARGRRGPRGRGRGRGRRGSVPRQSVDNNVPEDGDADDVESLVADLSAQADDVEDDGAPIVRSLASSLPTTGGQPKVAQRPYVGEKCPICYEVFTEQCKVCFCDAQCGNSVHELCYRAAVQFLKKTQCPFCRSEMKPACLLQDMQPSGRPRKRRRIRY